MIFFLILVYIYDCFEILWNIDNLVKSNDIKKLFKTGNLILRNGKFYVNILFVFFIKINFDCIYFLFILLIKWIRIRLWFDFMLNVWDKEDFRNW